MTSLKLHAAFLALAIVAALLTWTRDVADEADAGLIVAWDRDTADVASVHYLAPAMEVLIERRADADGEHLWAVEVEGEGRTDTLSYPVGIPGHTLIARLARLRVIREMGELSPEAVARFGLDNAPERVAVRFADGERELLVGDSAFGGADRYALEPATGAGYVIGSDITGPLAIGEGALRERWLHRFADSDVAMVRVALPGGAAREMNRTEAGEWVEPVTRGGEAELGTAAGTPDAAFANFMQRVGQLAIGGYGADPDPASTRPLVRVDYLDDQGEALGFVEIHHDPLAERDPYYIRSETTRIVAFAVNSLAERVEQGLADVF